MLGICKIIKGLKNKKTEAVAQVLMDIHSCLEELEEVS